MFAQYQSKLFRLAKSLRRHRRVTTWSHLASAFNTKSLRLKPLAAQFLGESTGLFKYKELQEANGFYLMQQHAACCTEGLLHEALSSTRSRKMVQIFDELSDSLCKVADLAEFIRIGHPNERFAYAAKEASISVNSLVEKLNTNRNLYNKLKVVIEKGDICSTTDVDDHVAKLFLFDFEQCGIHLDEEQRAKVVEYNDYILHVGSYFMTQSLSPRSVIKSQLPESIRNSFTVEGDSILVTGLFADSENELVREAAYKIYLHPNKQQEDLLNELLTARHKLATLCGFPTYAHRAMNGSIAGHPEFVQECLQLLASELRPRAEQDYAKMLAFKKKGDNYRNNLMPWDVPYFTSKVKREQFDIHTNDYCSYFSLGACMDGLNSLFQSIYGITLEVEEVEEGEVWHEDIKKLAVKEDGDLLGYIYCDFYERTGKPNQDCHFTIQGGRQNSDGSYQKPIVVLMLNLSPPTWGAPSLLTHGMVDNLFHEMGHAMHSMLARTTYQHVTGTRCSTDLAEVPSVLMEYFASDPRVVRTFARHYKTGEYIPFELANKLSNSKKLFAACETQLQVFYAAFDQACHRTHPLGCSTTELLAQTQNSYYSLPHVPNTAWHLRFGHLVGYGAKYYSYLMSRAIASWIWHLCFKNDPFNRREGNRYRQGILAHGGSKDPRLLVEEFLGSSLTPKAVCDALIKDIDSKRKIS